MPVDPTIDSQLAAAMARGVIRQSDHADEGARRQSDGAAFDMRALGAAIAREIVTSNDPMAIAGLNTASHVPGAQPFVVPNFVNPQGGPPATKPG